MAGYQNELLVRPTIRVSTILFTLYLTLLPISTALSGLFFGPSIQSVIAILFIAVSAVEMIISGRVEIDRSLIPVYVFFLYSVASVLWNPAFKMDWDFQQFFISFALFIMISLRGINRAEKRIYMMALYMSLIVAITAAAFNLPLVEHRLYVRITSTMDPNDFACGLSVVFAMCLTDLKGRKRMILNILCIMVTLIIVFLTGSRGGMLVFMAMTAVWIFSIPGVFKYKILIPVIFAVAALLVCAEIGVGGGALSRLSVSALISGGGTGRAGIWAEGIRSYLGFDLPHMLFGNGLTGYSDATRYVADGYVSVYMAHNMFLNELVEGGIVGITLMAAAFISLYRYAIAHKNLIGVMVVTGFLVEGISLDCQFYRIFGVVMAFCVIGNGILDNSVYKGVTDADVKHS
ncbi:MAG: O-antigen ligase family protein [Clostridiales bacterium]|nr:O-antigen ligase family protein [Clostridiales bacterium]